MGNRRFLVKFVDVSGVDAIAKRDQIFSLQSMPLLRLESTTMAR